MNFKRTRGIGTKPNTIMLVSDYPGRREAETGLPLQGKTGDEVRRYFDGYHLPQMSEVYVCNLIREFNPANEYSMEDVKRDEDELIEELLDVNPSLVVTLGRWSARWFLGGINLDEVQSLPWYVPSGKKGRDAVQAESVAQWALSVARRGERREDTNGAGDDRQSNGRLGSESRPVVFPLTNPAAGFRSPEVQAQVSHGFRELALYLDGKTEARELFKDDFPNPTYLKVPDDPSWLDAALTGMKEVYIDSEGHPDDVWSVQWARHPGTAYLISIDQKKALYAFFHWLVTTKPLVTYHGSLHDFGIMRVVMQQLGIDIDQLYDVPFDDTQIMAYLLQIEPIGLKPNCVRHCNMQMQDYDDVLGDAQTILAHDYLLKVFDHEQRAYKRRQREEFERINQSPLLDSDGKPKRRKDGSIRYRKTTVLPKLPMSDLHKAAKRVIGSNDPYKLWSEQREDILVAAYNLEVE